MKKYIFFLIVAAQLIACTPAKHTLPSVGRSSALDLTSIGGSLYVPRVVAAAEPIQTRRTTPADGKRQGVGGVAESKRINALRKRAANREVGRPPLMSPA